MELNTSTKRQAFKLTMKVLGKKRDVNRRKMCKILTDGNEPYKRSSDAGSFLKELVKSEDFPIERQENSLIRSDIKRVIG